MKHQLLTALAALALVACGPSGEDPANQSDQAEAGAVETLPADEGGAPPAAPGDDGAQATSGPAASGAMPVPPNPEPPIPSDYHGRWALAPADCTTTRGDAKGLMVVGGETILFYESLATAQEELAGPEGSYTGRFAVTGEGQSWEAVMRLTRTGDSLTRTQDGTSYRYKLC